MFMNSDDIRGHLTDDIRGHLTDDIRGHLTDAKQVSVEGSNCCFHAVQRQPMMININSNGARVCACECLHVHI